MCNFFSLVSDGKGKMMYFDWELRKKCIEGKLNYQPDSHTSIADYFGYKGVKEDRLNKYEYNPVTKNFQVDQKNTQDDSKEARKFCEELNFKKIVPQLIIPDTIIHPFNDFDTTKVTKKDLKLLKKWLSVRASVRDSVWGSVRASVRDLVWGSVRASVRDSVWGSVGSQVGDSVGDSVWGSVWGSVGSQVGLAVSYSVGDSVRASVRDLVWAYVSSMFNLEQWKYIEHKKGVNPFQSCINLWCKGLVPSFDGKIWRLHGGKGGKIIWEEKI